MSQPNWLRNNLTNGGTKVGSDNFHMVRRSQFHFPD